MAGGQSFTLSIDGQMLKKALPGEWLCGFRRVVDSDSYLECELPLAHKGDHIHGEIAWPNLASEARKQYELDHAEKYGGIHLT
jgi:hypothetical protein